MQTETNLYRVIINFLPRMSFALFAFIGRPDWALQITCIDPNHKRSKRNFNTPLLCVPFNFFFLLSRSCSCSFIYRMYACPQFFFFARCSLIFHFHLCIILLRLKLRFYHINTLNIYFIARIYAYSFPTI